MEASRLTRTLDAVHIGAANQPLPDWRTMPADLDPDDEELDETPADVIAVLGFDPKDA